MKRVFKITVLLIVSCIAIVALVAGYLFLYEGEYDGLIDINGDSKVFIHRGYGNHAPDNSLSGAKIAVGDGFTGVDVDAQYSKDKQVVVFHDVDIDRFTSGTGRVASFTLVELQEHDISIAYGDDDFAGEKIATFEDFVREITPQAQIMVELKVSSAGDTGIERSVSEILERYDAHDQVLISAFNPVVLYRLKKIDSRIRTVFIFMDQGWDPKRVAQTTKEDRVSLPWYLRTEWTRVAIRNLIKPDALSINYEVEEETIDQLIQKGYPVFLWSLNDEEAISFGVDKKPYGLITDEPFLIKEITGF